MQHGTEEPDQMEIARAVDETRSRDDRRETFLARGGHRQFCVGLGWRLKNPIGKYARPFPTDPNIFPATAAPAKEKLPISVTAKNRGLATMIEVLR